MGGGVRYRGREITPEQIQFIRELIHDHPECSRRALSVKLCEAWDWRQSNGQPCDMICRGLMLRLEREGLLKLPPKKAWPHNPLAAARQKPPPSDVERTAIGGSLQELGALEIRQVRRSRWESLWGGLIEEHHYLGYCHPVGEQLKYLVFCRERPLACFSFSSAPRHLGPRDRYIGWNAQQRKGNLQLVAYNSRFLILPWVRVPHLASHLLARIAGRIAEDWQSLYQHRIYLLETFVDTERFAGTCYRAANWVYVGSTTGRGKEDLTHRVNRSIKAVWVYALHPQFRRYLCGGTP
jgi:hypothetical protein